MRNPSIIFFVGVILIILLIIPDRLIGQSSSKGSRKQIEIDTVDRRLIHINDIYIVGNVKTQKSIITRELSIREGDYIPGSTLKSMLEDDRNKIYNTNLFATVEIQQLELDSTEISLLIKLQERWYFYPIPVLDIHAQNFNTWWNYWDHDLNRLSYGIKLYQYNFRGRNERLKLTGQTGFENSLNANYRMPYIEASQRHGLTFNIGYSEKKTIAYQTVDHKPVPINIGGKKILRSDWGAGVTYSLRNSFYTYHYVGLGAYESNIADTIAVLNPNYFASGEIRQQAVVLSYTYNRDYRDNRNYPLQGIFYYIFLEKVGLGFFNDVDIWRIQLNFQKYFDLKNGFYLANTIKTLITNPRNQPYSNFTGLGYGNSYVRGYNVELIEGSTYVLGKNTLRKRIFKGEQNIRPVMPIQKFQKIPYALYVKTFADFGWIDNYPNYEQSQRLTNQFLYGVGVGADFVTLYDQTFRFEFSYNGVGFQTFFNFKSEF